MQKIAVASGYFDPLHAGHLEYLKEAKKLGNKLIVIVNNDEQARQKKGRPFMPEKERLEIVKSLKIVDDAVPSIDKDRTVAKTLDKIASEHPADKIIFTNGGDVQKCAEEEKVKAQNIDFVYGVGGGKIQSSSWLTGLKEGKPKVPSGKLEFCLNETKKALENMKVLDKKAEELLKFARDYYNDAVHYKEKDPATALEAAAYAHGFIDSCVLLGLAEIPGYHLTKKD